MHRNALTAPEQRVLGCLLEKRWTTPDQYPLSVNALRLACNQSTNRDPVTDYDEDTVRQAAHRLTRYELVRLASGHTSRSIKFRHLAEEGLGLDRPQLAVLAVLLLRGPQTPGEIKTRSERMAPATLEEVEQRLEELGERGYVRRLERRPGPEGGALRAPARGRRRERRPGHGGERRRDTAHEPARPAAEGLEARVTALESEVAALRDRADRAARRARPAPSRREPSPRLTFTDARADQSPGTELLAGMRAEISAIYDGQDLDGPDMPKAGPSELGPPDGAFLIGWEDARPVCCGGVKRLPDGACEIKRMFVVPGARGRGVARALLHALEARAQALGYTVLRLDTGPRQPAARHLYESEGYAEIENFNANPVATYFGEKRVGSARS